MALLNSTERYGTLSIAMHWLTAVLMVAVYALIELHEALGRTPLARSMEDWHSMVGLLILLLVLARLPLRLLQPVPVIKPALVAWQHKLSVAAHLALYGLMLVMPLLGWLLLSAEGHDVAFLGIPLPALTAADSAFADQVKEVHEVIGTFGYALIGVHTAAAIFHHHFLRDNTLLRMLPKR